MFPAKHLRGEVEAHGRRTAAEFLLDDAADVNVVSQSLAVGCQLQKVDIPLPSMEAFRGERGYCYGAYRIRMRLADSTGQEKVTTGTFYGADLEGPSVLLGRPWRRQYGIFVDSRTDY